MQLTSDRRCSGRTEAVCLTLQSDLDLAFSYLRLADAEIRGGKAAHATELIAKAVKTYKSVQQELVCIPDYNGDKRELAQGVGRLWESIQSVERQFRIL
jgi:hypothetical protein